MRNLRLDRVRQEQPEVVVLPPNTAVVAPIPSVSEMIAVKAKPGRFRNSRREKSRSWRMSLFNTRSPLFGYVARSTPRSMWGRPYLPGP